MNRWFVLAGAAAALATIVALELLSFDDTADSVVATSPSQGIEAARPAPPAPSDTALLANISETVLQRPLFSPERKAAAGAGADVAQTATDELPRLAGVIVGPSGRRAIFADSNGHPKVASEGTTLGRFTVRSIAPGQVILTSSEGDRVLRPAFTPAPAPDAGAPQPPPGVPPFLQPNRVRAR